MRDLDLHQLAFLLKFFYSIAGLLLGTICVLGGIILFFNGIGGTTSWVANFLGSSSKLSDAPPGAVIFATGVFIILITRFSGSTDTQSTSSAKGQRTRTLLKFSPAIPQAMKKRKAPETIALVGVVKALGSSESGGELLDVESTTMPGKGRMTVTGNMRIVMQESVVAASSYVRSRAVALGIEPPIFDRKDIHVHVPAATPKDGASAGVAMVTAITSCMTGIPVRPDVAMTGEITLRGRVLPVDDIENKLQAAYWSGVTTVLIPEGNLEEARKFSLMHKLDMEIVGVSGMDEVLIRALIKLPNPIQWDEDSEVSFWETKAAEMGLK
jgi:hypothetical protein